MGELRLRAVKWTAQDYKETSVVESGSEPDTLLLWHPPHWHHKASLVYCKDSTINAYEDEVECFKKNTGIIALLLKNSKRSIYIAKGFLFIFILRKSVGRERESQAGSMLSVRSWMWGLNSWNCEIMPWAKTKSWTLNRLSQPRCPAKGCL